ncbi:MAG: tRNA 2-thiouridine(34) synthase MnmA [Oscillospiraceae bacterium]|nr:tRNA 2-thiouridine(34) synthase MnmA [Oscillospiraceae bacterium]
MKKVLLGMSGGVDSSVSAIRLIESGYEVCGCSLKLYDNETVSCDMKEGGCCSLADIEDAKSVCRRLGIDHITLNFSDVFEKYVIRPFAETYRSGQTPNPCIECNRHMKFDLMLEKALMLGYDHIATGHYAVVRQSDDSGRWELLRSADSRKDQTYVLYCLSQYQLGHTLFPLGDMEKADVRALAEKYGLINSHKPDSQDICFVPDGDYTAFIDTYLGERESGGVFADRDGNVMGTHPGVSGFTIGQRRGLGMAFGRPVFVTDKNASSGVVTLGDESDLFRKELILSDYNDVSEVIGSEMRVTAKARYTAKEQSATAVRCDDGVRVIFDEPVRAPAPGQACVLYDGERVVGGGVIKLTY